MELLSQNIQNSTDPETKGFDLSAGNTWIYPENYPVREYQYNVVKTALYHNTLVCLPTGLGKTFIAAVVMYNFWRWYPFGKIVFLAPTKPLVAQQINACYEVMGIPSVDMIELTGAVNQKNREIAWFKKRIIFATPQVFHNDLEKSIVPNHLVKCVVVDEAHKALGKHSYCECIRILSTKNQYFRVLALSATPGNKIDNVHEVVQNLHISHLELRDENSLDIMPYVNKRKVDIILVPLSNELAAFKDRYIIIMDRHVKSLIQLNILRGHTANISKGRIFHLFKEFQKKTDRQGNHAQIMKTLNILLSMYHAYELMIRHGLRAFCKFYQNHSDKFWMHNEKQLQELLHDITSFLGPFPDVQSNGDVSEIVTDLVFGHNKFYKLKELLERHFRSNNGEQRDTRAIVFVEYRDIVNEVYVLLLQSKPVIRPQMFVGQVSQKQKQQIKALEDFRNNRVNVLISTSIGEEGLDVGEVDLIICFDVSQHSPIRLVQRMGRTGRKRDGHIIVLVTDGKEHENLKSTLSRRDSLNNKILNTSNIFSSLYQNNFRMIPDQFTPQCHKMHIIPLPKTPDVKKTKKRKIANKRNKTFEAKQKENSVADASQSFMMKFLNSGRSNTQKQDNIPSTLATQNDNVHNTINPSNVKLLSDDKAGNDFLTLCALKRSEEEMSSEIVRKMDTTYIPAPKPVKDLFNFVVPDTKVLDCLSFLSTNLNNVFTQRGNCEDENMANDYANVEDDNFWCTIRNEENTDNHEVRFEDILDESSDSNETIMSSLSQGFADIEIDLSNTNKTPAADVKDIMTDCTNLSNNLLKNMEPGMFEDILNDSFSSFEDVEEENTARQNTVSPNFTNNLNEDTEKIYKECEDVINISHCKNNVDKTKRDLSVSVEHMNQTNKYAENFSYEMEDFDFDCNDINEFACEFACEFNTSRSLLNPKAEESLLSVTQAIGEIARTKSNAAKSPGPSVSKEESSKEESSGWISVNTKCEADKRNTNTGIKNKLSNINRSSNARPCTTKLDFDFADDSDEDFIITQNSEKKFAELESSYFSKTSKNSKDESDYFSRNESQHFSSALRNFDMCSSTAESAKPCGVSTPINNKRVNLSLKRNKSQHSSVIDLSVFKAPSKSTSNGENRSTLQSSVSVPRRTFPLDKKIVRKMRDRDKVKNEFINDEAEVSFDVSSSDESIDTTNEDLPDFVSYTQHAEEQVDMQAHYLQTIKSPIKRPGTFHFRKPRSPDLNVDIYSQSVSQAQDSYLYDSFCVKGDTEPSMLAHNDSILEMAERELERNKRKRVRVSDRDIARQNDKKKRTNILNNSMSSEDEIEQLRVQVQDE